MKQLNFILVVLMISGFTISCSQNSIIEVSEKKARLQNVDIHGIMTADQFKLVQIQDSTHLLGDSCYMDTLRESTVQEIY